MELSGTAPLRENTLPIWPRAGGSRFGNYNDHIRIFDCSPSGPVPVETGLATTTTTYEFSIAPHLAPCRWKQVWQLQRPHTNFRLLPIRPCAGGSRFGNYNDHIRIFDCSPSGPVPVEAGLATTTTTYEFSIAPHPALCRWKRVWQLQRPHTNFRLLPIWPRAGGNGFGNYNGTWQLLFTKPASTGTGPDGGRQRESGSPVVFQTCSYRHWAGWGATTTRSFPMKGERTKEDREHVDEEPTKNKKLKELMPDEARAIERAEKKTTVRRSQQTDRLRQTTKKARPRAISKTSRRSR